LSPSSMRPTNRAPRTIDAATETGRPARKWLPLPDTVRLLQPLRPSQIDHRQPGGATSSSWCNPRKVHSYAGTNSSWYNSRKRSQWRYKHRPQKWRSRRASLLVCFLPSIPMLIAHPAASGGNALLLYMDTVGSAADRSRPRAPVSTIYKDRDRVLARLTPTTLVLTIISSTQTARHYSVLSPNLVEAPEPGSARLAYLLG